MAAEIKMEMPSQEVTLIHARDRLLSSEPLPDDFKDHTYDLLQETGVRILTDQRVVTTRSYQTEDGRTAFELTLESGSHVVAGSVIAALSKSIPSLDFLPTEAIESEGYVKIDPS